MKRTRTLRLVLLGGGVVAMVAGCGEQQPTQNNQTLRFACEQAKQQNAPNAMEVCRQATTATSSGTGSTSTGSRSYSGGGGWFPWFFGRSYGANDRSYTGSWFSGRSSSSTSGFTGSSSGSSSSSRGGFGATSSSAGS
jgi:hypothetical protein